jgi:CheY-like chemotaxis protein
MTNILVIEDEATIRGNLLELLEVSGYDVFEAENGVVGVQMARKHHPDLIICDIRMPKLDGIGVLEELQKDLNTASIPFIILTASVELETAEHDASAYLIKPYIDAELLALVHKWLTK